SDGHDGAQAGHDRASGRVELRQEPSPQEWARPDCKDSIAFVAPGRGWQGGREHRKRADVKVRERGAHPANAVQRRPGATAAQSPSYRLKITAPLWPPRPMLLDSA